MKDQMLFHLALPGPDIALALMALRERAERNGEPGWAPDECAESRVYYAIADQVMLYAVARGENVAMPA